MFLTSFATLVIALCCPAFIGAAKVRTTGAHFMGNITSTNSVLIRDVGTHGNIGKWYTNSYGDTFRCPRQNDQKGCIPLASNTLSYCTDDPLRVTDFNVRGPDQVPQVFCGPVPAWGEKDVGEWGFGISNVLPTSSDMGIVFVWRNYRPFGKPQTMLGSGVAVVDGTGAYPTCTRTAVQWWDATKGEPLWGDHSIVDGKDGYIYAYGQIGAKLELYLARVKKSQAFTLSAYQYWDGIRFTSKRLINPSPKAIVLKGNTQGSIWWSDYHHMWASISRDQYHLQTFTMALAPNLWGPWGPTTPIFKAPTYKEGAWAYAPTHHPGYDMTFKSLVFSYTQEPNIQQAARVYFE